MAELSADSIVDFMHRLADRSADVISPLFRSNLDVQEKGTDHFFDPVTEGDRQAEAAIRSMIEATFADHAIVGEEFGTRSGASPYRWIIDPIDGTRAFILGLPTWATLIGLEHDGRPRFGMMNQPYTGDRFWSDGTAAFLRNNRGDVRTLQSRRTVGLAEAQMASTHPGLFADGFEASAFQAVERRVKACRYGTDCFAYAMLAAGLIDVVVEAGLKPYDIVALIPIIEASGGVITTWDGKEARHGGRILAAANEALHREAMDVIAAIGA